MELDWGFFLSVLGFLERLLNFSDDFLEELYDRSELRELSREELRHLCESRPLV